MSSDYGGNHGSFCFTNIDQPREGLGKGVNCSENLVRVAAELIDIGVAVDILEQGDFSAVTKLCGWCVSEATVLYVRERGETVAGWRICMQQIYSGMVTYVFAGDFPLLIRLGSIERRWFDNNGRHDVDRVEVAI